jgi:ribosome maturation factor RimP
MINKERIEDLAQSFLEESTNYLIDVRVNSANKILVYIENDIHVSIKDCIQLSKHIEHNLDREVEDFELEVSSPGIDQPFRHIKQYYKYAGKEVDVILKTGQKLNGELLEVHQKEITIQQKAKKKKSIENQENSKIIIPLSEIKETRLHINFK